MAWCQSHVLLEDGKLWGQLTMPPHDPLTPTTASTSVRAEYTKLRPCTLQPKPNNAILHQQVRYTPARTDGVKCHVSGPKRGIAQSLAHLTAATWMLYQGMDGVLLGLPP